MKVSAIVPTIGRPESLRALLESLAAQTRSVDEVIIADASTDDATESVISAWALTGLVVTRVAVHPPNAVRQRNIAIELSNGEYLLFLDDDVVLEPDCVAQMLAVLEAHDNVVAVTADFNNQNWPVPTRIWQLYLRYVL